MISVHLLAYINETLQNTTDLPQKMHQFRSSRLQISILDLGAGTGLFCEAFKSLYASFQSGVKYANLSVALVGVDLSPKMVAKARERNCYDEVYVDEIVTFMESRPLLNISEIKYVDLMQVSVSIFLFTFFECKFHSYKSSYFHLIFSRFSTMTTYFRPNLFKCRPRYSTQASSL